MTKAEADVALKYSLLCSCSKKKMNDLGVTASPNGIITKITECYSTVDKRFFFSAAIAPTGYRTEYCLPIEDIEIIGANASFIETKIKQSKKALLKDFVASLIENMSGKREIYAFIGNMIDEIKEETNENQRKRSNRNPPDDEDRIFQQK